MSVYHTPRCRIDWTNVRNNGVDRDVVDWSSGPTPLTLSFGLEFDPDLYRQAHQFHFYFPLPGASGHWWGTMNQLPGGGYIWVSMSWEDAGRALDRRRGPILYRPHAEFVIRGALNEYAVAEEDHYIFGEGTAHGGG